MLALCPHRRVALAHLTPQALAGVRAPASAPSGGPALAPDSQARLRSTTTSWKGGLNNFKVRRELTSEVCENVP